MARHEGAGHDGTGGKTTEPSKRERERLRRAMLSDGHSVEQVVVEMMQRWGTRRRKAWRHAHGWTLEEVAARYNQHIDDPEARMAYNRISDYEAWPDRATNRPSLTVLTNLAAIYGTVSSNLVDFYDLQHFPKPDRVALQPRPENLDTENGAKVTLTPISYSHPISPSCTKVDSDHDGDFALTPLRQTNQLSISNNHHDPVVEPDVRLSDLSDQGFRELALRAARESRDHAESAVMSRIPEMAIDEIGAEVRRLARESIYVDSGPLLPDMIQMRNKIYRLLERRQYPHQTADLYYLASITCLLLANSGAGFGMFGAAQELSRAAWSYAEIIGHNSLRGFARTSEAAFAAWAGRPQRALELTLSSEEWATEAIGQVGFHGTVALYSAATGRSDEARSALGRAVDAYNSASGDSELFDHFGGIFAYPQAKLHYAETLIHMELRDSQRAETAATQAINAYETGPAEMLAWGNVASTRIDLAHARLLNSDVQGARDALENVLRLPAQRRVDWVVLRLKEFYRTFRTHEAAVSIEGRQLSTDIEDFCLTTAATTQPNLDIST